MSRLRLLLFWLVVLAVPVQGWAATTKLLCASVQGLHHEHGAAGHDHDHDHASGHPHAGSAHSHGPASSLTSPDDGGHQCGLCAACGHALSTQDSVPLVLPSPAPQAGLPDVAVEVTSVGVTLPDKPPRA